MEGLVCSVTAVMLMLFSQGLCVENEYDIYKGYRYNITNPTSRTVRSKIECSILCSNQADCLSVNMKAIKNHRIMCELIPTRTHKLHELIKDGEYAYACVKKSVPVVENHVADICTVLRPCQNGGSCVSNDQEYSCICGDGFIGPQCEIEYESCSDLYANQIYDDGVYSISNGNARWIQAFCELNNTRTDGTNEGGWMVIQRRVSNDTNFYRTWIEYVSGFGILRGDFWLGLDNLEALTSSNPMELHVYMETFENLTAYAHYERFLVNVKATNYRLYVEDYRGTAGDSLVIHDGKQFSTYDRDNDESVNNCAQDYTGGWWYGDCHDSNLNGMYQHGYDSERSKGINWKTFMGYSYSLKTSVMKIRKIEPSP